MYELIHHDLWEPICFLPITSYIHNTLIPHHTVSDGWMRDTINNAEQDKEFTLFNKTYLTKYCNIRNRVIVFISRQPVGSPVRTLGKDLRDLKTRIANSFNTECIKLSDIKEDAVLYNRFGFKFTVIKLY